MVKTNIFLRRIHFFDFIRAFASATAQLYKPYLCRIMLVSWNRQVQGSFAVGI